MFPWATGAAGGGGVIKVAGLGPGMVVTVMIGRGAGITIPIGSIGITGPILATIRHGGKTGGGGVDLISGAIRSACITGTHIGGPQLSTGGAGIGIRRDRVIVWNC